ncbi:PREDICTED: uncharacterized protein LOC106801110 [Ceratotherium simum simum]|uniref:Arginine/serine-rich protein 1 n=1 Tax=Ceratotherium simum simum TaxID=73337 RepID=A0ABM1CI58_CERSS|nr:PREDICTED: uncharacterized protein LOC106801110 [Ceratotherium simum simum]
MEQLRTRARWEKWLFIPSFREEGVCWAFVSLLSEVRLESVVIQESGRAREKEQVKVSFQKAPPEKVQAPLAVFLAEPVEFPQQAYAVSPGRRYYGFDPMVYPKEHSSWRERSRKRSWSRTPFHLSEKDKMELLEIAKASAAKSLGIANLDLPVSLKTVPVAKERNCETAVPNTAKFESSNNENASEYNTNTSMTQTIPKKKTKRLCYFNVRWKDIYSWIREKWKEIAFLDICLQDGCHCCQP